MISYPVNPNIKNWAVYDTVSLEFVKYKIKWPRIDGNPVEGLDPNLIMLEVIDERPTKEGFRYTEDDITVDLVNETATQTYLETSETAPAAGNQTDWKYFRSNILNEPLIAKVAAANGIKFSHLSALFWRVPNDSAYYDEILETWNQTIPSVQVLTQDIDSLQAVLDDAKVPISILVPDGTLYMNSGV